MPVLQPIYRSGTRGQRFARGLVASAQSPASHQVASMVFLPEATRPIEVRIAHESMTFGRVVVPAGTTYYLICSPKFQGYYYVLYEQDGQWVCTATDRDLRTRIIDGMKKYLSTVAGTITQPTNPPLLESSSNS